jgi:hypothetical protein
MVSVNSELAFFAGETSGQDHHTYWGHLTYCVEEPY